MRSRKLRGKMFYFINAWLLTALPHNVRLLCSSGWSPLLYNLGDSVVKRQWSPLLYNLGDSALKRHSSHSTVRSLKTCVFTAHIWP